MGTDVRTTGIVVGTFLTLCGMGLVGVAAWADHDHSTAGAWTFGLIALAAFAMVGKVVYDVRRYERAVRQAS